MGRHTWTSVCPKPGRDLLCRILQTLHESQRGHLLTAHTALSTNCMSGLPMFPCSVESGGGCVVPLDNGGGFVFV